MDDKLKNIKPRYAKYRYKGTTGYHIQIGRFALLITEKEPDSLMVFRDGLGHMVASPVPYEEGSSIRTEHSGCPIDITLEDETDETDEDA